MGKKSDKIKKFIVDDRPQKLKSYLIKHQLNIDDCRLKKGQTLLHYSVKKSASGVLGYLLRVGFDVVQRNDKGQTPLDLAIRKALKSKRSKALKIYQEVVVPLVDHQSEEKSPRLKLTKTHAKLKQLQDRLFSQSHQDSSFQLKRDNSRLTSPSDSDSNEDFDDTEQWNEKLSAELEDEYMCSLGNYEKDFGDEVERETYDQWSDRMHCEYKLKQAANRYHPYNIPSKSTTGKFVGSDKHLDDKRQKQRLREEKLRQKREELEKIFAEKQRRMKEISKQEMKYKYEEKYTEFLQNKGSGSVKFCDIPWPFVTDVMELRDVLFCDFNDNSSESFRKYLREQQVRWHPDKFQQNFGELLAEGDKNQIMERVTEISQYLNKLTEK